MMDSWLWKIALAGGIVILLFTSLLVPQLRSENPQDSDLLIRVLGGTADFAAEQAYKEADIYFHAGYNCECPEETGHPEKHEVRASDLVRLPLLRQIEHLQGEAAPKIHKHLVGDEEKEILPWFVAAVRLNPHFIDAWRVGGYWFSRTSDGHHGVDFVSDGIRHNPGDYRLYLDRGVLYHRLKEWSNSVTDLETAEKLWKNDSEDSPYELRAIRTYLGDSRMRQSVIRNP